MRDKRRPRAVAPLAILLLGLLTSGCLDFVAPEFPDAGAPAAFNGALRFLLGTTLQAEGTLVAGRAPTGFRREVPQPAIHVLDALVPPDSAGGVRLNYLDAFPLNAVEAAAGVPWTAPVVAGVGEAPTLVWYPYRPVAPDTFSVAAGADLVVRLEPPAGATLPAPAFTQWFVTITGGAGSVRVSADGVPPTAIRIPPSFLPPPAGDQWSVRVQVFENVTLRPGAGDYLAQLLLETRYEWRVTRVGP